MPLFSVSLLYSLEVQAPDAPEPLRELAIIVLFATDAQNAKARGEAIGRTRQASFRNGEGDLVRDHFRAVIEVQSLIDDHLSDGIEVASWMFRRGESLIIDEHGIAPRSTRAP